MPTKAKNCTKHAGFFEHVGAQIDSGLAWISRCICRARTTYVSINSDYVRVIRAHKLSKILPPSLIVLTIFFLLMPFFIERVLNNDTALWSNDKRGEADSSIIPVALTTGGISQVINHNSSINNISSIGLPLGTYERHNTAEYEFALKKDDDIIYSRTFSSLFIKDNEYFFFQFAPIQLAESSTYSFTLRALSTSEDNYIAIYYNEISDDVVFAVGGRSVFFGIAVVASIVFLVVFFALNLLINSGKIKNDYKFLACMTAYIFPLVFIYPALTIPDEPYHFLSAVRLAEYDWSESPARNLSRMEVELPSNSSCLAAHFQHMSTPIPSIADEISECFRSAPSSSDVYIEASNTSRVLAYAPSALGIKFGDLISDSPMIIFYCGRIFNLITVSVIIIFALSLIKKHRMLLLAVVLIPMFLQQSISYSYDGFLNALSILVVAYGIRFLTMDVKVRKLDIMVLIFAIAFIGLIKLPYILVAAPLLAVKSEKFSKHKFVKWLTLFSMLAIAVLFYIFTMRVESIGRVVTSTVASDSDRGFPLSSLFTNPLSFIGMLLQTLYDLGAFYLMSAIGYFGWFYFSLDSIIVAVYLVFIVAVVLSDHEVNLGKFARFWLIITMAGLIGSFFLVMYLQWTPKSSAVIEGVQGRYFLPAIPLLMLALTPKKNRINLPTDTCYVFFNLITFCYIITLLVGFY